MAFPPSPLLTFARAASEQEARLVASAIVGPEHLFLALLWPEATVEPTILKAYGITIERARVALHELTTWGGQPARGTLPVAVSTERAYEIAERYAEGEPLCHGDLLIGVLSVRSPTLERVLLKLGIGRSDLRTAVHQTEEKNRARRRAARQASSAARVDSSPLPAPAPNVIDLRPAPTSPGVDVPGEIAPESLEDRIDALSERVDALLAYVTALLAEHR